MQHKIFTIYDEKAKAYLPPFFLPESAQAIRAFTNCINSSEHQFAKNPDDYTLFSLGTFDDSSAELVPGIAKSLGNGLIFLKAPNESPANEKQIGHDSPIPPATSGGDIAL